jgi:CRP-like cAMP-binding protein
VSRQHVKNQILQRLSDHDYNALVPHLKTVSLSLRQTLCHPGKPIKHVYFLESGAVSMLARHDAWAISVGLVGDEGMTDQVIESGDTAYLEATVQTAGTALAVEAGLYVSWIDERPLAMNLMRRYQQALSIQSAYTALSHGSFKVEERVARWLLMSFDRTCDGDLPLVHHQIADMLCVRRAGVTMALHVLEGQGAIRATRGRISLRDRALLISLAAGSYGVPEREYQRLLGPLPT